MVEEVLPMSLPPLQLRPISTSHYYISGDVTIQDGAAIAPGVLLQAEPNCRVIIKTGACIGIGSILHASNGTIEVGEGANVGAEVLLIGNVMVGAKACLGSATTILNSSVERGQIIPPGSLIGDTSRRIDTDELQATDTVTYPAPESQQNGQAASATSTNGAIESVQPVESSGVNVYGQVYVNQLLVKMFPHSRRGSELPPKSGKLTTSNDPWED
jgi:carbon dioxide concentrating mechanism protein CcmN